MLRDGIRGLGGKGKAWAGLGREGGETRRGGEARGGVGVGKREEERYPRRSGQAAEGLLDYQTHPHQDRAESKRAPLAAVMGKGRHHQEITRGGNESMMCEEVNVTCRPLLSERCPVDKLQG